MTIPEPPPADELAAELARRRAVALEMGGTERVARHHASGRLTVRERIDRLVDRNSWLEVGMLAQPERRIDRYVPGDAVVTGFAEIDGRPAAVIGIDATVLAGTTAPVGMRKQGRVIAAAGRKGFPIVMLVDADGGRIPDVMGWRFSGLPFDFSEFLQTPDGFPAVPRAVAVLGASYGDAGLHAATADFVAMTAAAAVGLSGPSVIEASIGESITDEQLGGAAIASRTGTAHLVVDGEEDAFSAIRAFLSYVPSNASLPAPHAAPTDPARPMVEAAAAVPDRRRSGYDMYDVIEGLVDAHTILPWRSANAPNLITALARLDGEPIGVIANQPMHLGGVLDNPALAKELDFVDLCDRFNLPLVFLQDVPGLMVGSAAERDGIVKSYERIVARISRARVPKISFVLRKAYGGGHYAMGGRPTRPDFLFCWPTAELGFMAPEAGVRTVHRRQLDNAAEEHGLEAREALFAELSAEWTNESEPWEAAAHGFVDDIIFPSETRATAIKAVDFAWGSRPRVS